MSEKIYRVQAPDGRVLRIAGPEGASEQQLIEAARGHYSRQSPGFNARAFAETMADTPRHVGGALSSFATGAGDLAVGAGQLVSKITPEFIGRPLGQAADYLSGGTGEASSSFADRYGAGMRQRESQYQASRDNPDLPDVGRLTGSVVAGMGAGGTTVAPTVAGRMAAGGKVGGALGLTSPVDPEAENYWTRKGIQTGVSAAGGALAVPAVEGLIRGVTATVNFLTNGARGLARTLGGQTSEAAIERALQANGVSVAGLPDAVRAGLVSEVQKSLKSGGTLDADAVRRLADFQRFNIQPTQGQISRNPLQFAREQNYARMEIGQPIAQRLGDQNRQLIGAIDDMRGNLGASGADPYAAGQNVIAGLRTQDAARKAGVDAAYTQARSMAGIEADVPAQPVAQRIGQLIEDFGDDKIPAAVMTRIKSFGMLGGQQTRVFNIREAEKLKTLIGNNIDNPNTPTGKALTLLSRSVDDAVNSLGDDAGSAAAGAFRNARGLAAERFGILDRAPGMARAISREPGAPERFIEQTIIRGSVDDVANTIRQMRPQDRAEVRAAVLDWIKARAVVGVEDSAKFTQSGLNRAVSEIGERKLQTIFAGDRQALAQLQALGRVGAYVQAPPVASGVNYSSSGTMLADTMDRATRLPLLNILGRPGDIVRGQQAAQALRAIPTREPMPAVNPELDAMVRQLSSSAAAPGVAGYAAGTMDDQTKRRAMARALRK